MFLPHLMYPEILLILRIKSAHTLLTHHDFLIGTLPEKPVHSFITNAGYLSRDPLNI